MADKKTAEKKTVIPDQIQVGQTTYKNGQKRPAFVPEFDFPVGFFAEEAPAKEN